MRKFAALLLIVAAPVIGFSAAAAATSPYPPDDATLSLSPSSVTVGGGFTATLRGCDLGETVSFTVSGDSDSASCTGVGGGTARSIGIAPLDGTASVRLTAPSTPGTYTVRATGATSGATATATLTVVAAAATGGGGGLPSTGSDSAPIAQIAGGVVIAGLGLTAVALYRRRAAAA